jgi:hypothetical protein
MLAVPRRKLLVPAILHAADASPRRCPLQGRFGLARLFASFAGLRSSTQAPPLMPSGDPRRMRGTPEGARPPPEAGADLAARLDQVASFAAQRCPDR